MLAASCSTGTIKVRQSIWSKRVAQMTAEPMQGGCSKLAGVCFWDWCPVETARIQKSGISRQ
jgi:hypothetical protein